MQNTGKPSEDIFEENMKALGAHVYRFEDHADVNKSRVRKRIVSSKPSDYLRKSLQLELKLTQTKAPGAGALRNGLCR